MWGYGLSFVAGTITVFSPCVLPMIPILVGSAGQQHKYGPVALTGGLIASFVGVGMAVATVGFAIGLDGALVRNIGAALLLVMGLLLLSARLQERFSNSAAPLASTANRMLSRPSFAGLSGGGIKGQFAIGALMGAIWSPCAGPTLGAAIGLATQSGTQAQAAATMAMFGIGASIPMLAIAYGAQSMLIRHRSRLLNIGAAAKTVMGIALTSIGIIVLAGIDKKIETLLLDTMPAGWVEFITRL